MAKDKGIQLSINTNEIQLASDKEMMPVEERARRNLEWLLSDEADRLLIQEALGL